MKATIEIDATPQEMRELLGLPDVQSMQQEAMEKIREKLLSGIESNDMAELMKLYMPMPEQMSAMEGFQKTMWDAMMKSVPLSTTTDEK
ncbi:MAG: hypothetical protein KUG55_03470 [Cycloclasticus sp.]|jgi:hypothetical protein|nr:hypothetical protein [Cycloclasticus sp.]MDF1688254.1 hypothetical protein [Cycloclasticus sp.]MEE4290343.1 hypothetical protein [Cycloclasticus sp.]